MRLGEVLWKVGLPADEMSRIAKLLMDESSLNYRVFIDNCKGQKVFDDICRNMTRTITGFRPTSEPYRKRVRAKILKDLRENKASPNFWALYKNSVAAYVVNSLSALNQLLIDTEVDDEFEPTTNAILTEITGRSMNFSVHDRDVEALYELWPFPRIADVGDYLARCPKFDRFRAIDDRLTSIESRLNREILDLREHTTEDVDEIKRLLKTKIPTKAELLNQIEASQRKADQAVSSLSLSVDELQMEAVRVRELARRLEAKWTTKQQKTATEQDKEFEKLNQAIRQLKNEFARHSEVVADALKAKAQTQTAAGSTGEQRHSPFSIFEYANDTEGLARISVAEGLNRFIALTSQRGGSPDIEAKIFFYTALLANCLIVLDQVEWGVWESVVGWCNRKVTTCATPLWVDEYALAEQFFWLFDQPEEPRCLEIVDFDVGHVEGYLTPFLRAWSQSGIHLPWKKIVLIPSEGEWFVSDRLAAETAVLPKIHLEGFATKERAPGEACVVAPLSAREFLKKIDFAGNSRRKPEQSVEGAGGDSSQYNSIGRRQLQIIDAVGFPTRVSGDFAREVAAFWTQRCRR